MKRITRLSYDPYTGTFTVTRQLGTQCPTRVPRISPLTLSNIGDADIDSMAKFAMSNPGRDHVVSAG